MSLTHTHTLRSAAAGGVQSVGSNRRQDHQTIPELRVSRRSNAPLPLPPCAPYLHTQGCLLKKKKIKRGKRRRQTNTQSRKARGRSQDEQFFFFLFFKCILLISWILLYQFFFFFYLDRYFLKLNLISNYFWKVECNINKNVSFILLSCYYTAKPQLSALVLQEVKSLLLLVPQPNPTAVRCSSPVSGPSGPAGVWSTWRPARRRPLSAGGRDWSTWRTRPPCPRPGWTGPPCTRTRTDRQTDREVSKHVKQGCTKNRINEKCNFKNIINQGCQTKTHSGAKKSWAPNEFCFNTEYGKKPKLDAIQ